jgi:hypothetical protein
MGLLDHFEKLINEHGSAAILREQLALVKAEQSALERQRADLDAQCKTLQSENAEIKKQLGVLKGQVAGLQSGNQSGYVCDHCGSPQLKRTGNRRDPVFGALGIKETVFSCLACGKESAFTQTS